MSPSNVFLSPSFLPLLLYLTFLFPVFHSFCYVTPIFLPSICPSFPPARLSLCRPGGLSQSAERGVLPGPGLPGEVPLRRHRGRLLQPQTDPRASTHPRTHHRSVSRLTFYRGIIKTKTSCGLSWNCKPPHICERASENVF